MTHPPIAKLTRRCWTGLLAGILTLGACSPIVRTHGHRLDEPALAQITPGQTSREQVAQILGSPSALSTFDDSAWYYVSQRTERRSFYQKDVVEQKVVTISFDDQGVVQDVEQRDLDEARAIEPVERITPTEGNELSVFEQFIGNVGRFNLPRDAQR